MKKSVIITSVCLAVFSVCSVGTLISFIGGKNDISFPIGFGVIALFFAYLLFFIAKGKELPLTRLALKRTLAFCDNTNNSDGAKTKKLEKFLNRRYVLFLKSCPICGKTSSKKASDKPCCRCKTLFSRDVEKFTLECKGISRHRLASFYATDFNKLCALIHTYKPTTNVSDYYSSNDGGDININITITHN